MGMPAMADRVWTAAEVRALPDEPGKRFEVVDGELLVSPSPSYAHQRAVGFLYRKLHDYLRRFRAGDVLPAPADVELDERTLVQPDLFVVPLVDGRPPRDFAEAARLLLAIEVISPSTGRSDRVVKRPRYQRADAVYWIIDLDARLVERWTPGDERPEVLTTVIEWMTADAPEPLVVDLKELFAEALGEDSPA
jgi:Uma2 family endonuclease